mgnify:FL=1
MARGGYLGNRWLLGHQRSPRGARDKRCAELQYALDPLERAVSCWKRGEEPQLSRMRLRRQFGLVYQNARVLPAPVQPRLEREGTLAVAPVCLQRKKVERCP